MGVGVRSFKVTAVTLKLPRRWRSERQGDLAGVQPPIALAVCRVVPVVAPLTKCCQVHEAGRLRPLVVDVGRREHNPRPGVGVRLAVPSSAPLAATTRSVRPDEPRPGGPVQRVAGAILRSYRHRVVQVAHVVGVAFAVFPAVDPERRPRRPCAARTRSRPCVPCRRVSQGPGAPYCAHTPRPAGSPSSGRNFG